LGAPAFILKARVQVLRDIGACQAPFNSWLTIQGIETLSLRMDRHVANAQRWPNSWRRTPRVSWVATPACPATRPRARQDAFCPRAAGAILGFGIKGGREAGEKFINSLQLFSHLANVGDAKAWRSTRPAPPTANSPARRC
jgi:O-acetylhomoserine (thiol)-lyase